MANRRRKERPRRSKRRVKEKPVLNQSAGIDYGCLPNVMAISSLNFPTYLHDASIAGVAYGEDYSTSLQRPVPAITLIARNAVPVQQAFHEFNRWAAETDGDALEVTFVFRDDGSYLLALAPETTRLERRTLGYNRTSHIVVMTLIWVFPVLTAHAALRAIREYSKDFPAPTLFGAALIPPPMYSLARF